MKKKYAIKSLIKTQIFGLTERDIHNIASTIKIPVIKRGLLAKRDINYFVNNGKAILGGVINLLDCFDGYIMVESKALDQNSVCFTCQNSDGENVLVIFEPNISERNTFNISVVHKYSVATFNGKFLCKRATKVVYGSITKESLSPDSHLRSLYKTAYSLAPATSKKTVESISDNDFFDDDLLEKTIRLEELRSLRETIVQGQEYIKLYNRPASPSSTPTIIEESKSLL